MESAAAVQQEDIIHRRLNGLPDKLKVSVPARLGAPIIKGGSTFERI